MTVNRLKFKLELLDTDIAVITIKIYFNAILMSFLGFLVEVRSVHICSDKLSLITKVGSNVCVPIYIMPNCL